MKKHILFVLLTSIGSILYGQTIPSYVPASGLIAWYPFTGNTIDSSGNGYNGTDSGAILTTDRYSHVNSAYWFNGNSAITTSLLPPTGNAARTISCWFKYDSLNAPCDHGFCIAGYGGTDRGCIQACKNFSLEITYTSYPPMADIDGICIFSGASNTIDSLDKSWHFLAAEYDPAWGPGFDSVKIYLDGVYKTTSTIIYGGATSVNTDTLSKFEIGAGHYNCRRYFLGKIDDIGIWDRALTPCELLDLYLAKTNSVYDTISIGASVTLAVPNLGVGATYQWQVDTGGGFLNLSNIPPYNGVTTNNLVISPVTATMNGFAYRCIFSNGVCSDTSANTFLRPVSVAVGTIHKEDKINIFPNPANNELNIESTQLINNIEIINTVGQTILLRSYYGQKATIDIHTIANGIYFIKVNKLYLQKFIKQ